MQDEPLHLVYLSLGSNIDPAANLKKTVKLLGAVGQILAVSSVWETEAVGTKSPNFLNAAVAYQTPYVRITLKDLILHRIEDQLGRVRTADKNAARPIDLDIIIFDNEISDAELWAHLYIACPFAELIPELRHPFSGKSLLEVANELHCGGCAILHPEIKLLASE
jgi:2-amino-4-hydroxy-6-hydroxymethyldihydropteridine diphosphokinase